MAKIAFSAMFDNASGKMGTLVLTKARNGSTSRVRRAVKNPKTAAQTAVRSYLAKAARTFASMTSSQAQAWNDYGQTLTFHNPISGESYHPAGIDIFVALSTKFLQLSPSGTIPLTPPSTAFSGDTITVSADSETPGVLTFTASGANASGVTTEVLMQRLPGQNRQPSPSKYKHGGWKAFTGGSLTLDVNTSAGYYGAAYRFVKTATGQATDPVVIPIVTVALSVELGGANEQPSARKKAA